MIPQYAEKIVVSEKMLMLLPPNLSFIEAAGIPEVSHPAGLCTKKYTNVFSRHFSQRFKQYFSLEIFNPAKQSSSMQERQE